MEFKGSLSGGDSLQAHGDSLSTQVFQQEFIPKEFTPHSRAGANSLCTHLNSSPSTHGALFNNSLDSQLELHQSEVVGASLKGNSQPYLNNQFLKFHKVLLSLPRKRLDPSEEVTQT